MASSVNIVEITQNDDLLKFFISKFEPQRIAAAAELLGSKLQLETLGRAHIAVKLAKGDKPLDMMRTVITSMCSAEMQ